MFINHTNHPGRKINLLIKPLDYAKWIFWESEELRWPVLISSEHNWPKQPINRGHWLVDQPPSKSISTMNKMSLPETITMHRNILHIISTPPPLTRHGFGASYLFCTILSSVWITGLGHSDWMERAAALPKGGIKRRFANSLNLTEQAHSTSKHLQFTVMDTVIVFSSSCIMLHGVNIFEKQALTLKSVTCFGSRLMSCNGNWFAFSEARLTFT